MRTRRLHRTDENRAVRVLWRPVRRNVMLGNCFLGEDRWKSRWPVQRAGKWGWYPQASSMRDQLAVRCLVGRSDD